MMKQSLFAYALCLAVALILGTGCTKKFDSLNTDPTAYNSANFNPNYLLTSTQLAYTGSFDFSYETWRGNLIYASTIMQQLSTVIGYWAGDKYLLNEDYTAAYWAVAYPEQVKPVVDLVEVTRDKPQYKNLHQVARIMKAMIFQRISDLYGDVPYFDAGKGFYSKTYFPKYDKQQDIYNDILKELEEASAALDPAGDKPTGDTYYGGDIGKWQRFGYTLLLRAGMRLTKIDAPRAQAIVQKVIGKTFQSNDDNAFLRHNVSGGRATVNRNAQVLLGQPEGDNVKWSERLVNALKSTNDPRLAVVSELTNGTMTPALQKGMPNGYDLSGVAGRDISTAPGYSGLANYSRPSRYLVKLNAPTFILTYAEAELLLADAAQRFGIAGSAAEHYRNGVIAGITYLTPYDANASISTAAAEAFYATRPYNAATGLQLINTEYWIHTATMFDFYESWSNWRRSGLPVLTPVSYPGNVTAGTVPRRFPYPLSEANTNPDNYEAAHAGVAGGDNLAGRVWWDKP